MAFIRGHSMAFTRGHSMAFMRGHSMAFTRAVLTLCVAQKEKKWEGRRKRKKGS